MSHDTSRATRDAGRVLSYVGGWIGIIAMLALAPFFVSSGLVAPLWGVVALMAIWLALTAAGVLLIAKRAPLFALLVPVVAVVFWVVFLALGEHFLGWTA